MKLRGDIVDDFNRKGKGAHILLLSLGAGGVGLNLVGANHLFLIDMHWNPQLEKQVCLKFKYYINETCINISIQKQVRLIINQFALVHCKLFILIIKIGSYGIHKLCSSLNLMCEKMCFAPL